MADLQGTLSGDQVVGDPLHTALQGLPPDAIAAAQSLLSKTSAPTPEDISAAQQLAKTFFGPVAEQVQNRPAPTPQPDNAEADPMHQFLALLGANVAASVRPEFGEPTYEALKKQKEEGAAIRRENRMDQRDFQKQQAEDALHVASATAQQGLDQAVKLGDAKSATEQALLMGKINDAMERRRQAEHDAREAAMKGEGDFDPSVIDGGVVTTDFGKFIDSSKIQLYPQKLRPALLKRLNDNGVSVVEPKAAQQLGEIESSWRTLQEQAEQVKPYLSDGKAQGFQGALERGKQAATNAAKKAGGDPTLNAFDAAWGNSMRLLRATGPTSGFRFNHPEIERSMALDRPNVNTDTVPILEQKMRNWQTLINNATNMDFKTDWRSLQTSKGMVTVMAPDGSTQEVKPTDAQKLITDKGYARVFSQAQLKGPATQADPLGIR